MKTSNKYYPFGIPIALSIVTLLCFLSYFLMMEFEKEKRAINLERENQVFIKFVGTIDSIASSSYKSNIKHKKIVADSAIINIDYELKDLMSIPNRTNLHDAEINVLALESDDNLLLQNTISQIFTHSDYTNKRDSCQQFELFNDTCNIDSVLTPFSSGKKLITRINEISNPPTTWEVIQNMFPQIFFSMLLLAMVCLTFFLIIKNLNDQKDLVLLRNDFMSNMTHELKTPVSTISVALEALSQFDAKDNPQLRKEYINITKSEIERLDLLIDKSLSMSMYEAGNITFDMQPFDLKDEIEQIKKIFDLQYQNSNVHMEYHFEGQNFNILGDKLHFINIIHNLIENSIKYSKDNIHISLYLSEKQRVIQLKVSDNGIGISKEYQQKVFEKFFRVPQGNIHDAKGYGLGLSYVKAVVIAHQGTVVLDSKLNQGSIFTIEIPKQ